ncbi:uncharacterized protein LOC132308830 isoform X1 [Cornus florida]|uniref:uncharacterized protein LOC132308830 isoform X1 n=1 Tax=Cornus florida TaxID=4283 RepID=UPI0028A1BA9F|nr:uncharacterized protein LOC132308830 isoform X1 [Cornus florida]
MGSSSSKHNAPESSSSSSSDVRRTRSRSKGSGVFQSYCLRPSSGSHDDDNDNDDQSEENGNNSQCAIQNKSDLDQVKADCYRKFKVEQPGDTTCIPSNIELDEWGQSSLPYTVSRSDSSSSRAFSSRSLNPSGRLLSRFRFFPGNLSFRLSRAASLGSSRAYPVPSTNDEEELHLHAGPAIGLVSRNETRQGPDSLPVWLSNRSPMAQYEDVSSGNLQIPPTSASSDGLRDDQIISTEDMTRDIDNTPVEFNVNIRSPINHTEIDGIETRPFDRQSGAREPVERNVRLSRTLSVGRLRDRVLRRSSFPDLTFCPLQQEREDGYAYQDGQRQDLGGGTGALASDENALVSSTSGYAPYGMSGSLYCRQDSEVETSRAREARYLDLLEHGSNFLERRRRIRSQVRALQRSGSRFENLSRHERSCILSGQHRTGQCTCRVSTRNANSNDGTSARASISRIVMLAEALFEVLDEIHQQSVALSYQPSVSPIGSIPAPNEVVDSLPVKFYSKLQKHLNEESAQCYICLVEYEEGDSLRILPCHHEFHRTCIDKWLKEIHRVCPLCRGNICRSDSLPLEN